MCMGGLEALRNVLESLGAVDGWVISLFLVWDKVSNKGRKKPTINFMQEQFQAVMFLQTTGRTW